MGSLNAAIISPPINPRLISTAFWWKGKTWKIIVVGIRKSKRNIAPIFWLPPNIKNPEPKIRQIIAPTKRIDAISWGIPFEEIYSTVLTKPFILPGIADINIAEIDTLAKKSKRDLIPFLLKIVFFMIQLYEKFCLLYKYKINH